MYTKVLSEQCIACGLCQLKAPDIFEYDEDGIAYVKLDNNWGTKEIPLPLMAQFKDAYTACPTGAIQRRNAPFPKDNKK